MNIRYYKMYVVAATFFFAPLVVSAKKLTTDKVKVPLAGINFLLKTSPVAMARMNAARDRAEKILEKIEKDEQLLAGQAGVTKAVTPAEQLFIDKCIDAILEPVASFIDALRQKEEQLRPIVIESLGEERGQVLLKYFKQTGDFKAILKGDITSINQLKVICEDLKTLFVDIEDNLSADAKKAYDEVRAAMQKAVQNKL